MQPHPTLHGSLGFKLRSSCWRSRCPYPLSHFPSPSLLLSIVPVSLTGFPNLRISPIYIQFPIKTLNILIMILNSLSVTTSGSLGLVYIDFPPLNRSNFWCLLNFPVIFDWIPSNSGKLHPWSSLRDSRAAQQTGKSLILSCHYHLQNLREGPCEPYKIQELPDTCESLSSWALYIFSIFLGSWEPAHRRGCFNSENIAAWQGLIPWMMGSMVITTSGCSCQWLEGV